MREQRTRRALFGSLSVLAFVGALLGSATPASGATYTYAGTWDGQAVTLTHVPNATVEAYSDAQEIGQLEDFQTNDPAYSCLDGQALNVWRAPAEYPGELVVHNGDQGAQCAYGTWTFQSPSQAYSYSGFWAPLARSVSLADVANANVEDFPDARLQPLPLIDFQTNDPRFSCLDGEAIEVFYAPKEYSGVLVAHNGDEGPQCAYGTWTFKAPLPPPPPTGFTGISSGMSIATVTVTNVQETQSSDLFGPYYQMDYSATEASPIANSGYPDSGSFGAGQGCAGNCWTQTFMFPSDNVLDLSLTLYDNQTGWGGGMDYVNINGGNATDTVQVAGVTDTTSNCGITLAGSGQCSLPLGEGTTYLSSSGSSGGRQASVGLTVTVQDLFEYQAQQESQALNDFAGLYSDMATYFGPGPQGCEAQFLNQLEQQDSQLQSEMLFMIGDVMFGAFPVPDAPALVELIGEVVRTSIWEGAGAEAAQSYAAANYGFANISFPDGVSFDCTSDKAVWNLATPTSLGQGLSNAASTASSLGDDIGTASMGSFKSNLGTESSQLNSIISETANFVNQATNYYQAFGQNGGNDLSEFALPLLASACQFESYTIAMEQVAGISSASLPGACSQAADHERAIDRAKTQALVTRAQFAALVTQMFHLVLPPNMPRLADVGPKVPYYLAIETASRFMGVSRGYFRPKRPVARLLAAYTLGRLLVAQHWRRLPSVRESQGVWAQFLDTKDLAATHPSLAVYGAVAVEAGLVGGYGNHRFEPGRPLTQAQGEQILSSLGRA